MHGIYPMNLSQLLDRAKNKHNFSTLTDYSTFDEKYTAFIYEHLQSVIVAQNENGYRFFPCALRGISRSLFTPKKGQF
jgi:hypothetical protein